MREAFPSQLTLSSKYEPPLPLLHCLVFLVIFQPHCLLNVHIPSVARESIFRLSRGLCDCQEFLCLYERMVVPHLQDVTVNLCLLSPNARQFAWLVNCYGFI